MSQKSQNDQKTSSLVYQPLCIGVYETICVDPETGKPKYTLVWSKALKHINYDGSMLAKPINFMMSLRMTS